MKIKEYDSAYFIGVGGIGMSALARWFNANNFKVSGYDRIRTPLTQQLEDEGISINYEDKIDLIPSEILHSKSLIIVTPAIPKTHQQMNYLRGKGFEVFKRSQILGLISEAFTTVAVAGTHGKTTTSSMIAHLLKHAGMNIAAFLGGIATNYDTNFIANEGSSEAIAVVEADEFDRSFLTLHPDIAVVTSADADHLDIYGNADHLKDSFREFIKRLKDKGQLFIAETVASELVVSEARIIKRTYGLNRGQFFASNVTIEDGFFVFDYCDEQCKINNIQLGVSGFHNVENAVVAIAVARALGVDTQTVKSGMESYQGVKRRFEFVLRSSRIVLVDDYAHHPTEIEAFLRSLKVLYPDKKITAIFQPHLYTRTRDFVDGFAKSLSLADEVILLEIYPAREEAIEGVTSELIYNKLNVETKANLFKRELLDHLIDKSLEVVATIGAGDIDQLVEPIKKQLERRYRED